MFPQSKLFSPLIFTTEKNQLGEAVNSHIRCALYSKQEFVTFLIQQGNGPVCRKPLLSKNSCQIEFSLKCIIMDFRCGIPFGKKRNRPLTQPNTTHPPNTPPPAHRPLLPIPPDFDDELRRSRLRKPVIMKCLRLKELRAMKALKKPVFRRRCITHYYTKTKANKPKN